MKEMSAFHKSVKLKVYKLKKVICNTSPCSIIAGS